MIKKVLTAIIFSLIAMLAVGTGSVSAVSVNPEVTSGGWIGDGDAVSIDVTGTSYPEWLTLVDTTGFKVAGTQQICHAFPGGQDGWVADIRVKSGNEWLSVPTTQGWEPDEEGTYMACADVHWGTHALFGYYVTPEETTAPLPECDFLPLPYVYFDIHPLIFTSGDPYTGWWFEAVLDDTPVADGTPVSYKIIDSFNLPSVIPTTANGISETYTDVPDIKGVLFFEVNELPSEPWSATFRLTFPTCYTIAYYAGGGSE